MDGNGYRIKLTDEEMMSLCGYSNKQLRNIKLFNQVMSGNYVGEYIGGESMSEDKYKQFLAIINALEDKINKLNAKVKVYEDFIGKHKNVEEDINNLVAENESLKSDNNRMVEIINDLSSIEIYKNALNSITKNKE